MFNVIDITQAEYELQNERNLRARAMEGMTVPAPNSVDRIMQAVRTLMTTNAAKTDRASATFHPTVAK